MNATIPASSAVPGASYATARGTRVKVLGQVEGSTDVRLENEHGRQFTVAAAYPLELVAGSPPAAEADPFLELEASPPPSSPPSSPTATCGACRQVVRLVAGVLGVHQDQAGAYCAGSGTDQVAQGLGAAPELEAEPSVAPELEAEPELQRAPEAAELEADAPEVLDPARHLAGAIVQEDRVAKVREIATLGALAELTEAAPRLGLQAKVVRELERQAKALEAVEEAAGQALQGGKVGRQGATLLSRLAERQDYQARPGVMARVRATFAQLHGLGDQVDHRIKPAPAELEDPPEAYGPENVPAGALEGLVRWLLDFTGAPTVARATVELVASLASTVRESRAALIGTEDLVALGLAIRWERHRPEPRATILAQLEARVVALGGTVPELENPDQASLFRAPPAPLETPEDQARQVLEAARLEGDGRPAAYMAGRNGEPCAFEADTVEAHLWAAGRADFEALVEAGILRQADPAAELGAALEDAGLGQALDAGLAWRPWGRIEDAPGLHQAAEAEAAAAVLARPEATEPPPWELEGAVAAPPAAELPELENLAALPLEDQVARATLARALELVPELEDLAEVATALAGENTRKAGPRPDVVAALSARHQALRSPPPCSPPAPELEAAPPPAPAPSVGPRVARPPAAAVQVKDLELVALPDGRRDLWARPPGERPRRLGDAADPRLAQAVAAIEAHRAETRQAPPAPPPPPTTPEVVQVAQAGLSALAAALPALAAMGLDVTITISTRKPTA